MSANLFLVTRYIIFGLFTISNAVTCSVAAWNLGLVKTTRPQQVDAYLIFLGAFSLCSIITLVFVELLRAKPLTARVWFECAWVALFWVMQLAGGAALIAMQSDLSCSHNTNTLCTSERVLLAFTWTCAIILLIYLLVLVFIAASRYHVDLEIWDSDVRSLQPSTAKQPTAAPLTPTVVRTKRADMDGHTYRSRPTRIAPRRGSPSSKYNIESHPPVFAVPEQMDTSHSNLPEAIPLPLASLRPIPVPSQDMGNVLSVSLGLYDMPRERERVPSSSYPGPSPTVHVPRKHSASMPAPSPLGDWPRQDIMKQPAKLTKHKAPPSAYEFPRGHAGGSDAPDLGSHPRPRRPSGPRLRVPSGESGHRLQALDLYPGVSASYITGETAR